jgi:hypothetical protein
VPKGICPEKTHLTLLAQLQSTLHKKYSCTLLGDGEFDGIGLKVIVHHKILVFMGRNSFQLYGFLKKKNASKTLVSQLLLER